MPARPRHGATVSNVAAYVAQSVDRPGQDTGLLASAVAAPGAGKPAVEKAGKLEIPANPTGQLAYVATKATATPGAGHDHDAQHVRRLAQHRRRTGHRRRQAHDRLGARARAASSPRAATSVTVTLKPGTYTYFCQAPGHRAAGMFGTLTVK